MRSSDSLAPFVCGLATAIFAVASIFLAPELVLAQEHPAQAAPGNAGSGTPGNGSTGSGGSTCTCPDTQAPSHQLWPKPKFAGALQPAPSPLDSRDETAVLEAVHLALTEVGDGSAYVWHGRSGRLSGVVTPTSSFKDASGKICRHIVVALSSAGYSRQTEGVACRLATGTWQLEG